MASRAFSVRLTTRRLYFVPPTSMQRLQWKPQEISYRSKESCNFFVPSKDKPFVATRTAFEQFDPATILACLAELQEEARKQDGLDYLQVFESPDTSERLWFIEDGPGGGITALLPDDY